MTDTSTPAATIVIPLRAQQDAWLEQCVLDDLRRILAKHGVPPDEQAALIERKARWYGVPWQKAREDPAWYQVSRRLCATEIGTLRHPPGQRQFVARLVPRG